MFRTSLSETMSQRYGAHWFLQEDIFKNPYTHRKFLEQIEKICADEHDEEMKRYYSRYHDPKFPPSWILIERLSFGGCSNLFRNIRLLENKKLISGLFQYHPTAIESWIDALRYTRNLCAHHSRLWNRWFVTAPKLQYLYENSAQFERKFYAQVIVIWHLLSKTIPNTNWRDKLYQLFERYPDIPFEQMGFKQDWRNDEFWKK